MTQELFTAEELEIVLAGLKEAARADSPEGTRTVSATLALKALLSAQRVLDDVGVMRIGDYLTDPGRPQLFESGPGVPRWPLKPAGST